MKIRRRNKKQKNEFQMVMQTQNVTNSNVDALA
jgi:hypothetical protein